MRARCIGLLLLAGCGAYPGDPTRDTAVQALGPEDPMIRRGPTHRPGQPCLLCHSAAGGAHEFSVAGTVYRRPETEDGFGGADVLLVDSAGHRFTARSNCAGNFYVTPAEYAPTYPLWTTVRFGQVSTDMESMIHRDGSCAACHTDPANQSSAGHVFITDDPLVVIPPSAPCAGPDR